MLACGFCRVVTQQSQRRLWRHYESHDQREQHCRRCADRNRPHVWTHQSANKGHRQNGGDHGEGSKDRWIANFVHGFDSNVGELASAILWQSEMPDDVFDHDDRIVDENADGEDEREQRDAIERVTVEVEDGESERQRYRDRDKDHP